jgi:hydrophobic/amphiphilic exporter-1 (mainly G- bacteria), HAE1 family
VRAQGRLTSPEEFGEIILREAPDGGIVRVKDVARVELGAQDYSVIGRLNGKPSAVISLYQLPGSNAVDAAEGVKKLLNEARKRFPQDLWRR